MSHRPHGRVAGARPWWRQPGGLREVNLEVGTGESCEPESGQGTTAGAMLGGQGTESEIDVCDAGPVRRGSQPDLGVESRWTGETDALAGASRASAGAIGERRAVGRETPRAANQHLRWSARRGSRRRAGRAGHRHWSARLGPSRAPRHDPNRARGRPTRPSTQDPQVRRGGLVGGPSGSGNWCVPGGPGPATCGRREALPVGHDRPCGSAARRSASLRISPRSRERRRSTPGRSDRDHGDERHRVGRGVPWLP